ncbi:MAG: Ig-like domain-containing protein, partial [Caldilineaceae bacterium]|nr:Ig-like domain-containing protein [Caldilineaceae bacterium]
MNTFYQYSYRINALFLLAGLLWLALVGQQGFTAMLDTLHSMAGAVTSAPSVVISGGPAALLLVQADALVLPKDNGTGQVTARVRDAVGNPVAGVTVQFQGVLGNVNPANAITDSNGMAMTTFQSTGVTGRALVTATTGTLSREAAIQVINPATSATTNVLTLDFGASQLDPGETATIHAVLHDAAGQPLAGELVTLFGSLGEVTPASAMSDANGNVTATYHAGPNAGGAMLTALAG